MSRKILTLIIRLEGQKVELFIERENEKASLTIDISSTRDVMKSRRVRRVGLHMA